LAFRVAWLRPSSSLPADRRWGPRQVAQYTPWREARRSPPRKESPRVRQRERRHVHLDSGDDEGDHRAGVEGEGIVAAALEAQPWRAGGIRSVRGGGTRRADDGGGGACNRDRLGNSRFRSRATSLALRGVRMAARTSGSRMKGRMRMSPPHRTHRGGSTSQICFKTSARRICVPRSAGRSGKKSTASSELAAIGRVLLRPPSRCRRGCLQGG
jgi:hypothetical protein